MDLRAFFETGADILVPITVTMWVVVTFYALWRVGKVTDRAHKLDYLSILFDSMLRSDRRIPVWMWRDGRIKLGEGADLLLGVAPLAADLDALNGTGSTSGGLPVDTIQLLKEHMSGQYSTRDPMVVPVNNGFAQTLVLDVQHLIPISEKWPIAILWIEETRGESFGNATYAKSQSHRATNIRLKNLLLLLDSLPFPVWLRNSQLDLLDMNLSYVTAVDCKSRADVVATGKEMFDRNPRHAARQAIETRQPVRERQFAVVGGARRAFTVTHIPLTDHGEAALVSVAMDVTGEEEALSELSRVLDSQSETLNRLRSPVAIFGPNKTLRFYNNAFMRLSHLDEDTLSSGLGHMELLDAMREKRRLPEQVDFRNWKNSIEQLYTSLMDTHEEMWHLPDGTTHRVVTQPHPLGGLLILFEDVTDSLALERSYNTLIAVQKETLDNLQEGIAAFGGRWSATALQSGIWCDVAD